MTRHQKGFTLLETIVALAIFALLSILAFMVFSQANMTYQRTQEETQRFNQLQRTITILTNDLLQLVPRRNRSNGKIIVTGDEAIFSTQSRDPQAPLSEALVLQTVRWYLRDNTLYRAVRTSADSDSEWPAQTMLEHVNEFSLESDNDDSNKLPLRLTLYLHEQEYGELRRQFTLPEALAPEEKPDARKSR